MSSFLAASFEFVADVFPEPVCGGTVRDLVQVGQSAEFGEGQSTVQPAVLVEGQIQPAVRQHAPVEAEPAVRQPVVRRGAVRTQRVVPAGLIKQAIDRFDIIEE